MLVDDLTASAWVLSAHFESQTKGYADSESVAIEQCTGSRGRDRSVDILFLSGEVVRNRRKTCKPGYLLPLRINVA